MTDSALSFVRLKSGDDVICELVEVEQDQCKTYQLINPLKVVYIPGDGDSYLQIAFLPWVFGTICGTQTFDIDSSNVLLVSTVAEGIEQYYYSSVDKFAKSIAQSSGQYFDDYTDEEHDDEISKVEKLQDLLDMITNIKRTYH